MQSAKISLAEKSGQLVMSAREAEYRGNLLNQLEEKLRHEKVCFVIYSLEFSGFELFFENYIGISQQIVILSCFVV